MKRERSIEVSVETETLLLVGGAQAARRGWCAGCGSEATFVTPLVAARALGVSTRRIYARVETGSIHYTERADATPLVCLASAAGLANSDNEGANP